MWHHMNVDDALIQGAKEVILSPLVVTATAAGVLSKGCRVQRINPKNKKTWNKKNEEKWLMRDEALRGQAVKNKGDP